MKMQTECDLELRLLTPSYDSDSHSSMEESSSSEVGQPKKETQLLTIFYNGQMCVSSDLTNLQAKTILSLASGDVEERLLQLRRSNSPIIPNTLSQLHHQKTSMKRSLRCFLQKRNVRIQATCPYHHSR